jgi:signal transduction histidine kinase
MTLEVAGHVPASGPESAEQAAEQCRQAIQHLKDIISGLDTMPPVTADLSQAISDTCIALQEQFGVTVDVSIQLDGDVGAERFEAVLRIVREGVTNVGKHTASKRARLRVEADSDRVSVTLQDDGDGDDGADPPTLPATTSDTLGAGYGLRALRGSLRAIGGTLDLATEASGSTLPAVMPLTA